MNSQVTNQAAPRRISLRRKTFSVTCVHENHPGYREEQDGDGPSVVWTQGELLVAVGWRPRGKGGSVVIYRDKDGRPYVNAGLPERCYVDMPCPEWITAKVADLQFDQRPPRLVR